MEDIVFSIAFEIKGFRAGRLAVIMPTLCSTAAHIATSTEFPLRFCQLLALGRGVIAGDRETEGQGEGGKLTKNVAASEDLLEVCSPDNRGGGSNGTSSHDPANHISLASGNLGFP